MKAFLIIIAVLVVAAWQFGDFGGKRPLTPADPEKTATELAREASVKADAAAKEQQWQTVLAAGGAIRQAMRNPDSIVYEEVRANPDASVICFQYRAQNGFGGMGRETVAIVNGKPSQARTVWNKNCTKPLQNLDLALWQLNRK